MRPRRLSGLVVRPLNFTVRWQRWAVARSRTLSVIERLVVAVERVVEIKFGVHVPLDQGASLVTGFGTCGLVRALDDTQRNYAVTVRRAGAMEYLETQLARGVKHGWFAWHLAAP